MSNQNKNKSNTNKGNSPSGEKPSLKKDEKQSNVTIDEYGQLVRKPKTERRHYTSDANNVSHSPNTSYQTIPKYFKALFTPRDVWGVFKILVFVYILFISYWSATSHESVALWLTQGIVILFIWLVFDLGIYGQRENSDTEQGCFSFILLLLAVVGFTFINILFYDNQYQDKKYTIQQQKEEIKSFQDIPEQNIGQTTYVALSKSNIYNNNKKRIGSLRKNDTCIVVATKGKYFKIKKNEEYVYAYASYFTPLTDELKNSLEKEKREKELLANYERINTSRELINGQVYQAGKFDRYIGNADRQNKRHGTGSYWWQNKDYALKKADSVYIGEWDKGLMSGHGTMFCLRIVKKGNYYQTAVFYKKGVWKDNVLIDTLNSGLTENTTEVDNLKNMLYEIEDQLFREEIQSYRR